MAPPIGSQRDFHLVLATCHRATQLPACRTAPYRPRPTVFGTTSPESETLGRAKPFPAISHAQPKAALGFSLRSAAASDVHRLRVPVRRRDGQEKPRFHPLPQLGKHGLTQSRIPALILRRLSSHAELFPFSPHPRKAAAD